jgi:hypothetical protein
LGWHDGVLGSTDRVSLPLAVKLPRSWGLRKFRSAIWRKQKTRSQDGRLDSASDGQSFGRPCVRASAMQSIKRFRSSELGKTDGCAAPPRAIQCDEKNSPSIDPGPWDVQSQKDRRLRRWASSPQASLRDGRKLMRPPLRALKRPATIRRPLRGRRPASVNAASGIEGIHRRPLRGRRPASVRWPRVVVQVVGWSSETTQHGRPGMDHPIGRGLPVIT